MIPDFDIHGVIPPVRPDASGRSLASAATPRLRLRQTKAWPGAERRRWR